MNVIKNVRIMRKLRKFDLKSSQILSEEEMSKLYGMEFVPFGCSYEGQKCAVYATDGVNTGVCKWVNESSSNKYLTCVVD